MYDFIATVAANPDLLTDVTVPATGIAIDLGAYVGDWSQRMVERHGCRVYAFEPSPGAAAKTTERTGHSGRVTVFDYGIGGRNETARLARDGPGSSIYGGTGQFGSISVRIRDVVEVFDELGEEFVDVVKINIEGAEYDVIDRLVDTGWLGRIGTMSVQFHEWHPHAHRRRRRIRSALRRTHDEVWNYPWVWELWKQKR
jgi:FkbM family methyltransferase